MSLVSHQDALVVQFSAFNVLLIYRCVENLLIKQFTDRYFMIPLSFIHNNICIACFQACWHTHTYTHSLTLTNSHSVSKEGFALSPSIPLFLTLSDLLPSSWPGASALHGTGSEPHTQRINLLGYHQKQQSGQTQWGMICSGHTLSVSGIFSGGVQQETPNQPKLFPSVWETRARRSWD